MKKLMVGMGEVMMLVLMIINMSLNEAYLPLAYLGSLLVPVACLLVNILRELRNTNEKLDAIHTEQITDRVCGDKE
ncbi:hypothetical protein EDD63_11632 [Breznakia blatticola]|uniref:Uncharacterized protein n=1 Tax=Breznakia blatticola TaxID=1754012 RepID=A0A4R7ZW91_9FIRM|nr:hypothetical protein [Breznakia blatticola]TDW19930.1 hypothetical protein EDD63_11632 [Breznakia blatticola]